ncbi:Pimeloyl-ACP methyl ester carboxylesterase [Microbacterium sp. cf046]|uniref:alpha/beta fold hydrolase n=1 Tax=Microbacterium sp. cf046 TaxID=1761803 RepID=UPI0008E061A0|nr:alpha/beta hydrolase [Microbacterium sp. cf046]SFR91884.1 Pimeloyl-ACP methyl ester carboxylesterase [Microbacterium sp. cf046]
MGADQPVTVLGDAGPVVLLLPGGAEAVEGFFPGLPEGLLADPGCRIIVYDRPGTGHSTQPGSLSTATADLHSTVSELGLGPVVVIGQSLGGAVAALFARDHPEDVAGLLLLDPTPINDPKLAARIESTMRRLERFSHVPVLGRAVQGLLRSTARKSSRRHEMTPEVKRAMFAAAEADLPQLATAVVGLGDIARDFDATPLPRIPSIVVTADRPERSAARRAHVRLANALGAELVTWPKAEHHVHLSHPNEVLETARQLLARI